MEMRNLVTDVPGVLVGSAHDDALRSGVTAILFETPAIAAVDIRGGAPGTRDTDLLLPERTIERADAIVLSGGSAFGLDAASGAQALLRSQGRGFAIRGQHVPIVPSAIIFDLLNGGDKAWGRYPPYRELGFAAAESAGVDFALGTAGAGTGATLADLKGGLGSASAVGPVGAIVGAIAVVNAVGQATMGARPYFWAAPFEQNGEFGGKGWPAALTPDLLSPRFKGVTPGEATTIALVATNATLTKAQCRHLAVMAQDGLARALYPVHTPLDGDTVFAAATGAGPDPVDTQTLALLGALAANVLARAIARAVYEADTGGRGAATVPAYRSMWGG